MNEPFLYLLYAVQSVGNIKMSKSLCRETAIVGFGRKKWFLLVNSSWLSTPVDQVSSSLLMPLKSQSLTMTIRPSTYTSGSSRAASPRQSPSYHHHPIVPCAHHPYWVAQETTLAPPETHPCPPLLHPIKLQKLNSARNRAWCYNTCLACVEPWVQVLALPEKQTNMNSMTISLSHWAFLFRPFSLLLQDPWTFQIVKQPR